MYIKIVVNYDRVVFNPLQNNVYILPLGSDCDENNASNIHDSLHNNIPEQLGNNIVPAKDNVKDYQNNASEIPSTIHVTPVKVKSSKSVVSKSFYNIDFTATSTPMQPPRKRCRTRGDRVQIPSRNRQFEDKYKQEQININRTSPLHPLSPQQINNNINNNSIDHNTKGNTGPNYNNNVLQRPQLNFDDDILLNDLVDSSIPPFSPQEQSIPSAIQTRSSVLLQASFIPNIPSYNSVDDVFSWNNNMQPFHEFQFTGEPGVKVVPNDPTCPLSILKTFLTNDVINNIVLYTNTYAAILKLSPSFTEKVARCNRTILDLWKDVTKDDIWIYIAIMILMGITSKPQIHMYWSTDSILSTPIFSRLMRRDRFEQIRTMIHFTDPLSENVKNPLRKLSSFLDNLQRSFTSNYIPKQHVAVDEYLSPWKGRLGFRQYIPSKRECYGVKIYMLCESDTAYLWKFIVYTGAETIYHVPSISLLKPFTEYKIPSKIVLSLMDGLYNKGYNVTLDNLYTSPELLRVLMFNETDSYGTLRKKTGLPTDFWQWKPIKEVGEQPLIQFCEGLMVCRWSDCYKTSSKKIVSMMPTKHTGLLVEIGKVDYHSKANIFKPDVIIEYNKTMGGVDTLSRVINPYSIQLKGLKWYRKVAELFIDISIYNSFVIWQNLNGVIGTHLDFRKKLVDEIISFHSFGTQAPQTGPPYQHLNPLRLSGSHFIRRLNPNGGKRSTRRDCVRCKAMNLPLRVLTMYHCQSCNVPLCVDECFELYHTRKIYHNTSIYGDHNLSVDTTMNSITNNDSNVSNNTTIDSV